MSKSSMTGLRQVLKRMTAGKHTKWDAADLITMLSKDTPPDMSLASISFTSTELHISYSFSPPENPVTWNVCMEPTGWALTRPSS